MIPPSTSTPTPRRRQMLVWLAVAAFMLGALAAAFWHYRQRQAETFAEGATLHRILSQRVDQHDAHLTSLAALTQIADPPPLDAIGQVATSIKRFYPRIIEVDLIDLMHEEKAGLLGGETPPPSAYTVARGSTAILTLAPLPAQERLMLLKRVPATAGAQYIIVMQLDLRRLIEAERIPPGRSRIQLTLDGQPLMRSPPTEGLFSVTSATPLASRSQPLHLEVERPIGLADLFVWSELLVLALLIALAAYAADRLIAARQAARDASARASLAAQDARLAHASRVNAMGELASGIAHELTQPLTAILSQCQAGQRLAARDLLDRPALQAAFEASARNAKRAGDILGRLRAWVTKGQPSVEDVDLVATVGDVVQMIGQERETLGVEILIRPERPVIMVRADRVQMEQVIFNLIRNGLDALRRVPHAGRITIRIGEGSGKAEIRVIDNGPGLDPATEARLFEPFFTTKPEGMGLGLSLCTTLIERVGGVIEARNAEVGGAEFVIRLPLARTPLSDPRLAERTREAAE